MKKYFYFLTAVGVDQPGLVARVTGVLARHKCNLEDSSMMRLGSEFGMFAIFTAAKKVPFEKFQKELFAKKLFVNLKLISENEASFKKPKNDLWIIRVHGADQIGLVHKVTQCLADHKFNITDLSTHRTSSSRNPGYLLFIEGEPHKPQIKKMNLALRALSRSLETHISLSQISAATI